MELALAPGFALICELTRTIANMMSNQLIVLINNCINDMEV